MKTKKLKKIKTCAEFCKKVRELIPDKNLHSLVLNRGVEMGFFNKKFDGHTVSYSMKNEVIVTMEDVHRMAEGINKIKPRRVKKC
ncbi:MAG: hypothetical protein F6K62_12220 [Sphaerospermopsis sp. SIO1G2]|nr:hypothetical protein [Sphaerospermopsis sp. SIO1G2]